MGEKDLNIVKHLEHDLFSANLSDAMAYLANPGRQWEDDARGALGVVSSSWIFD